MKNENYIHRTIYRHSGNGRIISKKQAEKMDPRMWEKEKVRVPIKPKKKK